MKITFVTLFFSFLGFNGVFGIYDGKVTSIKKHPYVVAVDVSIDFVCPGAIIGKCWVLFSADCAHGNEASELQVLVGSGDKWSGTSYQAAELHVHPDYTYGSYDYNYALIKLESNMTFSKSVKTAKLPQKEDKAGAKLTVVGWGGPKSDEKLRKGEMKVMSNNECEAYHTSTSFTSRMGCLYMKQGTTACDEDNGDPVTGGDTLYHLVLSVSDSCDSTAAPIITAAVYPAVSWIKNITGL